MRSKLFSFALLLFFSTICFAKIQEPVLMHINGKPIYKSEFEYIYNKNNSNKSLDKKTLDEYLNLFINFKLKVEEAKAQGLDTTQSFISELSGYRNQLTKPYLTDAKMDEKIMMEAYERMKEEINVSHIMILLSQNGTSNDTIEAWKKIKAIEKRLQKEDFAKVAAEVSDDKETAKVGGLIGWVTALQSMPYTFETIIYNTKVGKCTQPLKSVFGYHIIKVNARRPSQGERLAAHIMKATPKDGNTIKDQQAKNQIDSLYQRLTLGDDFSKLANQFSDDKGSASRGGKLDWFGIGKMIPEFENVAFGMDTIGSISQPFRSAYGWHIIKLIDKKGLPSFDKMRSELEKNIKQNERGQFGVQSFIENLKKEYKYKLNQDALNEFISIAKNNKTIDDSTFIAQCKGLNKVLFTAGTKTFNQSDFFKYLQKVTTSDTSTNLEQVIRETYRTYSEQELINIEDTELENKYEDFKLLISEYHDGILLFEISNKEVWDKASKDTEGLKKYFEQNKNKYNWDKPHYKGYVIHCKDKKTLSKVKAAVKKIAQDSIDTKLRKQFNNDSIQLVKIEKGIYIQGNNKTVDKYIFKTKEEYKADSKFPFSYITGKMLKTSPEAYTDVRGQVTSDYQEYLEKLWIEKLRNEYTIEINEDVLNSLIQN